jgi:hypothetical protein
MHAVALPEIATTYDTVGAYDQEAIHGFADPILTTLLDLVNPGHVAQILDAMAGNGTLTARLYDSCARRGLFPRTSRCSNVRGSSAHWRTHSWLSPCPRGLGG